MKKIKIGRYYYERIPKDENFEPKLKKGEDFRDLNIYTLCDNDGQPEEYFRRVRK